MGILKSTQPSAVPDSGPKAALTGEQVLRRRVKDTTMFGIATISFAAVLPLLLMASEASKEPNGTSGSICVATLPEDVEPRDRENPVFRRFRYTFTIQVDKREPVPLSKKETAFIDNLDLDKRHLVIIRDTGEIIESFYFTFEERGASHLCLSYGPWYQTWRLEPPLNRKWCRCKVLQ